ncbi:hypothetical protein SAMN05444360_11747 [Chryseobacterium carnipullorum]|nr:hypothetical protein SAMN05444360_11747 [Chryseobacterium carnipullorum]
MKNFQQCFVNNIKSAKSTIAGSAPFEANKPLMMKY